MADAELRADAVGLRVPEGTLLQPTSLAVKTGTLVALIGPSGSGKTTLLRMLAGIATPTEGRVTLDGDPLHERTLDLGWLPVGDTVHHRLTVREALEDAVALRLPESLNRAEAEARVDEVLAELRLESRAQTRIGSLSSGERKRAALAVELIAQPAMLLLDEPGTGLDPSLDRRLMALLRRLADDGRGVVVVTHATSSLALCDAVAVMAPGGTLAFFGAPAEALTHFGVAAFDEIYDALGEAWMHDIGDEGTETVVAPHGLPRGLRPVATGSIASQTVILVRRTARVLVRDQRTLAVLVLQAPIIALCIGLVLPRDVLGSNSPLASFYAVLLSFLLITGATWCGVTSSCRALAGEHDIITREAAAGVQTPAQLLARAVVLSILVVVQVVLLVGVTVVFQPLHQPTATYGSIVALCVMAGLASVAMGLALSALARSADQASSAVPLLLIPQLLFAGAIIPTSIMPQPVRALSALTSSRWGLAGTGNALDLDTTLSNEAASAAGYDREFFNISATSATLAMLCFAVILLVAADRALARRVAAA